MSGFDEISAAIGRLEAKVDQGAEDRRAIGGKVDTLIEANLRSIARVDAVEKDVALMKPDVEDWRRSKQRGIGYLAGAGLAGGGLATGFHALLKKWGFL